MGLAWNDGYDVGIDEVDRQHRELLEKISSLVDAMQDARAEDEVESTLRFLEGYATSHFAMEQELMTVHRYPGMADHLKEHAEFVATFTELSARLRRLGPSAELALEVNNKICNWLVRHMLGTDKPMSAHLRLHGVR